MRGKYVLAGMLFICAVILLSTVTLPISIANTEDTDAVLIMHFDEGSGTVAKDSSGNGNDGTIYGATWTTGVSGKALSFDGNGDYVEITPQSDVSAIGDFTISAWTYLKDWKSQITSNKDRQYVFDGHSHSKTVTSDFFRPGFGLIYDGNSYTEEIHNFIKYDDKRSLELNTQIGLKGKWIHHVFMRKGNMDYTYIDGQLISANYVSGRDAKRNDLLNMQHNWFIGTFSGNNPNYRRGVFNYGFYGIIDELRIYNRALTESEIKTLYDEQEGGCSKITNWETKCQGAYSPGQKVGAEMEFENIMGGGYNFKGVIIIRSPTGDEYTNSEVEWVPSAPNPHGKFAAGDALYVTIPEGASAGNYDMKLELWNDDTDELCDATEWKEDLFTVEGGDTPSNLLENTGFESGELDPWYSTKYYDPYDKCDWISIGVDSEARYEGDYGAYVDIQCSLDAWGRIIQEPVEIKPGEKLAVEAELMYDGDLNSGYTELWLVFLDADKKALDHVFKKYYESDFGAEDKWLTAVLPATTAPSNAKYVRIMVGLADVKSCRLNIDDVMLKYGSAAGNHPPSVTKIEPTSDSITIEPGETIEFKVKAEDVDEDVHINLHMIQWFVDDVWVETDAADGTSAEVSFSYTFENAGTYSVKATVFDEQMEEYSVTWEVNVGVTPKIIGFTQVPSNPVGTGEVYYVVTYKNDEQDEGFVTLDIQNGNKVMRESIEYVKGRGQLSDASKAAVKGNMAAIFEKVLDKMADEGLLDFFNDYLGQDLDSFLDVEDAIGFKIFSQVYSNDDYGEDYDIKVIVEDEEGKDSKALTTNVREYYIGIIEEEIEDTNNNPEDGRQIEGIINIPFNYCLPSHDAYIIFVGGEKIIEAYTGKVKSPNAKVMLPKFHLSDGTPRLKHLVKKGKENIKLTTHLFKNPQETKTKIEIVLVDDEGTEYSDDVTLDFQNNYYVNPNWEGRFTEYRRGNEIFKADLTKSQFEEEFKDTNVLRLTKEVEENLNNNKYYDGAYIPDEQRGYANNLMSFEAAELEFVGKNEIEKMKWINDIWEIYGWFGHMKTGVEILVQGADFVTNFNPTKFLLKTLAEEGIGLVISAATDVWKDALAGDGENIIAIYDDAPSGDLEGNKYGIFTHVHANQSKYEDDGELKEIINAKKIIWRFTQPFFLCESGKWEFVATGTGAGGIVDADYIPGGANCIEWTSKPEFISPKEKNTVSFAGEIKRGVFPDYENQRDLFFVIELPDAYGILYDKKGTGFKLSEFTGVETPIELPIEDNLNDMNEEIETEYTKLYDRAGDNIFRIYVKETEDKWCVKNDGVETDYYDFNPVTVHPRLFAVNLEKSLGKPYFFGFNLTVDKDLKADKYDDYVIKYGVFPGNVSSTSGEDVIYAKNYKYMISYDINSANGLNLSSRAHSPPSVGVLAPRLL